jgi:hypothetical protein
MAVTSPESPSPQQPYGPNDVPTIQPALSPAPSYMPGATPTAGYGPPYASQPWALQQRPPQPKTNWKLLALIVGALVVIAAGMTAMAMTSKSGNKTASNTSPTGGSIYGNDWTPHQYSPASPTPRPVIVPSAPVMHGLNEPVIVSLTGNGTAQVTIDQAKIAGDILGNGTQYVSIHVTIEAMTPAAYNPFFFKLKDADGAEYQAVGAFSNAKPQLSSGDALPAGQKVSGWVSFDSEAPASALHGGVVEYGLIGAQTYWKLP